MRLLLDTHALIWFLAGSGRLSDTARNAISDESNVKWVSAASAWEIATKYRLGRLPEAGPLLPDIRGTIERYGFYGLSVTMPDAELAGSLPGPVQDPFDRMLIAQAQARGLALVSNERVFDQYGIQRLW